MKKGVQLFTVRDYLRSPEEVYSSLRRIRDMGYNAVQAYSIPAVSEEEMQAMLDELGLTGCSADAELEELAKNPGAVEKAIENARLHRVNAISIGTLPKEWRESGEGYHLFAQEINQVSRLLEGEGLHLLYHPHALEFFSLGQGKTGMDILTEETDPKGLYFALDTHWLTAAGVCVTDWLRRMRGRMDIVHFKDYAIVGGAERIEDVHKRFAEVGEGNLNWPPILSVCREIGVEFIIVEQDVCPGDPFESLAVSSRNLTKLRL